MNLLTEGIEKGYVLKTEISKKLTVDGQTSVYPVYKVKLASLYYNDKNDRIATWISKYKKEKNINVLSRSDLREYNKIIQQFIYESNPNKLELTKNNIKLVKQREPGVVLNDGRIVDGNRRYTCLRMLESESDEFGYFETVILDTSIKYNEKEIKKLELTIQHGEDKKVDYDPIDRLVGIYNDIILNKLLSVEEYARCINLNVSEVNKRIEEAKLMVDFLDYIDAPNEFYIARELDIESILSDSVTILKKCYDEDVKEDIKIIIFSNILAKPSGDLTKYIRKIKGIVDSPFCSQFIEEQRDLTEKILDNIDVSKENNRLDTIRNEIRTNSEIVDGLSRVLEKTEMKNKQQSIKNEPLKILEKVNFQLENIDINIFGKLDQRNLKLLELEIEKLNILKDKLREGVGIN